MVRRAARAPRAAINWFRKLPGYERSPSGLEMGIFRVLPRALLWGSALPGAIACFMQETPLGVLLLGSERSLRVMLYELIGFVCVYWIAAGTVAIGCILVMIMKGPAYIADDFPDAAGGEPARGNRDRSP